MRDLSSQNVLPDALAPYADVDRRLVDGRPWVLANMVSGLDGSTAIDGRVGALSSPTDRRLFVDLPSVAELCLTLAPIVGGDPLPVAVMPPTAATSEFRLGHVLEADGNLLLRYERR